MSKFDFGKGLIKIMQGAAGVIKNTIEEAKIPDVKLPAVKIPDEKASDKLKNIFKKKESAEGDEIIEVTSISAKSAAIIFYYLIAADGEIQDSEMEMFLTIGNEIDPKFVDRKDSIVEECKKQLEKVIDPDDYFDVLQDGVEAAIAKSKYSKDSYITPKLLVWNLLTIAYSDREYAEAERKLLKYIVRKLNIDKAVFLEMENSILTLMDLEREVAWIKTTDRPYLTIEAMVNEIADRKNVIFESVKDLITL